MSNKHPNPLEKLRFPSRLACQFIALHLFSILCSIVLKGARGATLSSRRALWNRDPEEWIRNKSLLVPVFFCSPTGHFESQVYIVFRNHEGTTTLSRLPGQVASSGREWLLSLEGTARAGQVALREARARAQLLQRQHFIVELLGGAAACLSSQVLALHTSWQDTWTVCNCSAFCLANTSGRAPSCCTGLLCRACCAGVLEVRALVAIWQFT